jgi:peptide/nickel transport system substrate-binding protein
VNNPHINESHPPLERKTVLSTTVRALENLSSFERLLFFVIVAVTLISGLILLLRLSKIFTVEIPSSGGTIREGIVGTPRFINPLIPFSDADRDMVNLIYSGLLKAQTEGTLIPDLADSYTISPDGKVYTFHIRESASFHDKTPLTADDVIFTVERAQDPLIKSAKRANWEGVIAKKVNDHEVTFTLKQPYAPFIENMTLGILPKHIWKDTDTETFSFSQYNTEPIGSGPYKIDSVKTNASRVPVLYRLVPFEDYTFGEPYIDTLAISFYKNEESLLAAFENGEIDNVSTVSPEYAKSMKTGLARIKTTPLPRVFGLFFNENVATVFTQSEVRTALDMTAPRQEIVQNVLLGYGNPIHGPIPPGLLPQPSATTTALSISTTTPPRATTTPPVLVSTSTPIEQAQKLLAKNGWKYNETEKILEKKTKTQTFRLSFSISTGNAPDLKKTAEMLKAEWEKLGAQVEIKTFDMGDLNQTVIRPRKYDALLFGEIVGRDLDLFAFWHSSQRNDPGLNIALYTNSKADKILEDVRTQSDVMKRLEKYSLLEQEIAKDVPAIFLYSPDFIYIISDAVKGFSVTHATVPSERFENVHEWHTETDRVWKIFSSRNNIVSISH